ncbi:aldehyde ferredoxin oxidoreductase family protein [Desulfosporosinus sp. BICA1-9]|uniref:aldehyde ferredoxin oxidoreductase family protein n=1 Tax=Desulfosporosinus sp. BICA1-9 TaxID=1531958 RepID=UPI00054C184F|nr:aldehyde ferredoxin oxidoreductase family protein [Desulfosporosinus sp. BICA1-9]KJS50560.1 MAG: hypothetical protein VR66_02030 [Peptococcaceae bacterium BRH_c23]KJS82826.1 MAG: hypothetical protein JL57_23675 [Desulfosporosinus sp. BICA1-9]
MAYGYNGKILRVNLTEKNITVEEPGVNFFRRYLGGRGIVAYYLLKEIPEGIDAFSEENKLVFATSVVTGAPVPGFGRHSVGAKSPLTNFFGESEAGGFWGPELKFAGFEGIIVEGKSSAPVYIWINDGKVELKDASHLWGMDTADTKDILVEELGDRKVRTLIIGKGGENLVRFAGIASDVTHYHGRTGLGAVMGSKNLKAVVVRGTNKLNFKDEEKLKQISKEFSEKFRSNADNSSHTRIGTSGYYFGANDAGSLPTRNFRSGHFDELEFTIDELHDTLKIKTEGCYACPIRCKQVFKAEKPYNIDPRYGGPEYETLAAFGSTCGVNDMFSPSKAHELCNKYGLDTVSAGVAIAFAMECFENGLITKEDTGGIELKFGNAEGMLKILEMIASRDGFGDILAEGSKRAAEKIGKGAIKYAMQTKGQEFAMAEPRAKYGLGLAYAVSPTGADHLQAEHDGAFDPALTGYSHAADDTNYFMKGIYPLGLLEPVESLSLGPEKVRLFTYLQHNFSLHNVLDLCMFITAPVRTMKLTQLVDIVNAVTGWETSLWELFKTAERATTMTRCFNVKHSLKVEDDTTVPDRLFEGLEGGALKGARLNKEEFLESISLYYEMMGWDRNTGIPTEGKLHELGIGWTNSEIR